MRGHKGLGRRAGEIVVAVPGGGAEPLGRHREEECGALAARNAALARVHDILHERDFAARVEESGECRRLRRRRVERHVGEGLRHALRAVRAGKTRVVEPTVPLEVVRGVEPAGVVQERLGAVAFARMAEVGFAVDDRLAVRDGAQETCVEGRPPARRRHHDAAFAVGAQDVDAAEGGVRGLEADPRAGDDLPYGLRPEVDAGREDALAELDPLHAEPGALVGVAEVRGRLERPVARTPGRVHRGGVAGEDLPEMAGEGGARRRRHFLVRRLVEEFVCVWGGAVRLEFLGAGAPHFRIEGAALGRDEAVGHEMAGPALGDRFARGLPPLFVLHAAVRPARTREIDNRRQPGQPPFRGDVPVKRLPPLPDLGLWAERAQPRQRHFAADGIEAKAVEIRAVGRRFVNPSVGCVVALRVAVVLRRRMVVDDRAKEVAAPAVHDEIAVRRNRKPGSAA